MTTRSNLAEICVVSHLIGRRGESPSARPLSDGDGWLMHAVPMLFMPCRANLNCNLVPLHWRCGRDPAPLHLSVPPSQSTSPQFSTLSNRRKERHTEPETEIHAFTRRENSVPMVLTYPRSFLPPCYYRVVSSASDAIGGMRYVIPLLSDRMLDWEHALLSSKKRIWTTF